MSLLKLLATGKSLVGVRDTNSPYRMRTPNALPKFGSRKNPFAPPAATPPSGEGVSASRGNLETGSLFETAPREGAKPIQEKESKVPVRQPVRAGAAVKIDTAPAPAPAPVPTASPVATISSREPRRWFGWMSKLNPLSLLPKRQGISGRGGRGRTDRGPVQAELTLDRVRVVRNDLSDTDVEIVPGKLMGLPSGASPVLAQSHPSGSGTWSRLTSKFLGAHHAEIH